VKILLEGIFNQNWWQVLGCISEVLHFHVLKATV